MGRKQEASQSKEGGFEMVNRVEIRIQDASLLSLSRSASISPECCGWLYVLNLKNNQGSNPQISREMSGNDSTESWEQYYFSLKGGMLFGSSRRDGSTLEVVYVLCDTIISTIDSVTALQREYITREEEAELRKNVGKDVHLIILLHYNNSLGIESNPLIFAASSPNVSARWCIAMNNSLQYGQMRNTLGSSENELGDNIISNDSSGTNGNYMGVSRSYYRIRDINQLSQQLDKLKHQYKQMEVENKSLKTKNDQLQGQVKKLQSALNVTEKATGEAVEQKTVELTQVLKDLENVRGEKELLLEEKRELHDKLAEMQRYNQKLLLDKFEIVEELNELQDNISSFKSGETGLSKLINRLQYLKHSSQELLIENRKYKNEIQSILDHYREEQIKSDKQLNTIKDLFSQHDIFQLLIRQIELVQAKLQYQQEAWKMPDNQAENLLFWIQQLQNQWKVDEAVARASYLKHRSIVLGEQMKSYLLGLPLPTHYAIIQELLHKLQYIFREEEFSVATRSEFLFEDLGNTNYAFEPFNLNKEVLAQKQPVWDANNFKRPPLAVVPSIFGSSKTKLITQMNNNTDNPDEIKNFDESGSSLLNSSNGLVEYSSYKTSILGNSQYIPRIQVDLLSPPERNVPESEYERIKNSLRELQEKYRILESENEMMSDKIQRLTKIIKVSSKKANYRQNTTRTSSLIDFNSSNTMEESIKSSYSINSSDHINATGGLSASSDIEQANTNTQSENGNKNAGGNYYYPLNNKLSSKNISFDLPSNNNASTIEEN